MSTVVRTVLGDVPAGDLGVCDAHDHVLMASPLLPGEELADPVAATAELCAFASLGGTAIAHWTPFGLGRRATELAGASRASGVHVIAATGLHQAAHYPPALLDRLRDGLTELFVAELTEGMYASGDPDGERTTVRAGMIKVAGRFHRIGEHERWVMAAAARAHRATGAPIGVHTERGTAVLDVLDLLCGELDVSPDRVILGHLNRSPDTYVHLAAARAGAYLCFDGPSAANHPTDWRMPAAFAAVVRAGFGGRVLIGGDTTTAAARSATGGGPGMPYLLRRLWRRLAAEVGEDAVREVFTSNPARAFAIGTAEAA